MAESISISIVVPVYSGGKYLTELIGQIESVMNRWSAADLNLVVGEAIFTLDAPIDDSLQILHHLADDRPWIRVVELSQNFGQHSATVAGILYSSGDWVVTLDEDLQHRPEHIETMLARVVPDGLDIVYALPDKPVHGGGYRDVSSRLVKHLIGSFSGNRFVSSFNSFRLIRGDIARAASSVCGQHTYFDVALTWFTNRISAVRIPMSDDRYKQQKKSGYRFRSLLQHAKRLLLTSDFRVIRLTTSLAATTFLVALVYALWVLYSRFLAASPVEVQGWTSLMIVILAFGSVSVFMLGLIIEFLHMSVLQLQGKPAFFVVDRSSDARLSQAIEQLQAP